MATKTGPSGTSIRVRAGLALAAAGVLLAACGSSSKGASGSVGSVSTAPSTSSTSSSKSGSSVNLGGGSFCDKVRKAATDLTSAATGLATSSPDSIKQFEENALSELSKLQDQAPSEIKGAVSTILSTEQQLLDALRANNFDFTKVSSQLATTFDNPQFTQATQQVDTYLSTKCGINPTDLPSAFSS